MGANRGKKELLKGMNKTEPNGSMQINPRNTEFISEKGLFSVSQFIS